MVEIWKTIPGASNYSASNLGRLRGPRGAILIPYPSQSGYLRIAISLGRNGFRRFEYVHRLILLTFQRPARPKEHAHHKDGDKFNNALENLEWMDAEEHDRLHGYKDDIEPPI